MALAVAAVAIFLLALRPPRVPAWIWPLAGAVLLILTGNEPLRAAGEAIARQWNILLFILGLMAISIAADRSGAFEWIADAVVRRANGSRRRLFVLLFIVCSVVTVLLSNDATAIALTPIVYRAVRLRLPGEVKPFLLGCVFAANTASFGLPFSNPANVLILPRPQLSQYIWHLGPPQVATIAVTLVIFLFFFSRELQGRVDVGPSLITTGSLATILWMTILRGYGVRIKLVDYFTLGALVVPAALTVSVLWLWVVR